MESSKKDNTTIAKLLAVEGLDCKGFGNIYQFVMKDTALHIYAKALYAFLCSYSGNGVQPFPKRDTIIKNLMSKDSYYKYLDQLIQNGYIELKKEDVFPFKVTYVLLSNPKKLQEYQKDKLACTDPQSRLRLSGLKSEGYGNIPRAVMLDDRLTPQAKAIYAYFRSLSGMGDTVFPTRQTLTYHLQISEGIYNRHFRLLVRYNYIECIQRHVNGRFDGNDYLIIENPDENAVPPRSRRVVKFRTTEKEARNPYQKAADKEEIQCLQNQDIDKQYIEKQDVIINNNNNINNNIYINNKSYQSIKKQKTDGKIANTEAKKKTAAQVMAERSRYRQIIRQNIEYDCLRMDEELTDYLDLTTEVLLDTITSDKEFHQINRQGIPHDEVKERLLRLDSDHVRYVITTIQQTGAQIRNMRGYLLTALYNAPVAEPAYAIQDLRAWGVVDCA